MKRNHLYISMSIMTLVLIALASCGRKKASDPLADTGRTQRTENLLANMKAQADSAGFMFGHCDDTVYGIGWHGDSARSDVYSVCNDYPAIISFDLTGVEHNDSATKDGVAMTRLRQEILSHFSKGGVITLSWTPGELSDSKLDGALDSVCKFFDCLSTDYGVKVPVIFRPWRNATSDLFWWNKLSPEKYRELWKKTKERLESNGITNVLLVYSVGKNVSESKFNVRYPGDESVDIIGLDEYCNAEEGDSSAFEAFDTSLDKDLKLICNIARRHNKAAALTEAGYEGLKDDNWWTRWLSPVINRYPIAYIVLGRNSQQQPQHCYVPYPGQRSTSDFVKFYNEPRSLFLHDINAMYLLK